MARFLRHKVIGEALRAGLVPVFYSGDVEVALGVARAQVLEISSQDSHARPLADLAPWVLN